MRLRKKVNKQAVALAVVAAVAVSVPASASAVTYYAEDGTVTVKNIEDGEKKDSKSGNSNVKSSQEDSEGNLVEAEQKDGTKATVSYDTEININGSKKDNGDEADTNDTILKIEDGTNASGLDITIDSVKAETNDGDNAVIEIGKNVTADVTIKDVDITLGKVDDNDSESVENHQNGIRIGEGSKVTINVEGDNTIQAASEDTADNVSASKTDKSDVKLMNGIVVGGTGADYGVAEEATDDDKASVTITSKDGGSLSIKNLINGIITHNNSELTIDGNDDEDKTVTVNIEDSHTTKTNRASISGAGIYATGDLTVTDNANVNINNFGRIGIENWNNVTISDDAEVKITDDGSDKPIHGESGADTHSAIYHDGSKVSNITVDNAKLTIDGTNKSSNKVIQNGLYGGSAKINIINGAIVDISNTIQGINGGAEININSKAAVTIKNATHGVYAFGSAETGKTTVDDATLDIYNSSRNGMESAYADVTFKNGAKVNVYNSGNAGINVLSGGDLIIQDSGTVATVKNSTTGLAIQNGTADNHAQLIVKDGAVVNVENEDGHHGSEGIDLRGITDGLITGEGTQVNISGPMTHGLIMQAGDSSIENELHVTNKAELLLNNYDSEASLIVGYWNANDNKKLLVDDKAKIIQRDSKGNSVGNALRIGGHKASVYVKDAWMDLESPIAFAQDTQNTDLMLWIMDGAKVNTSHAWDWNNGQDKAYKFYITGGTFTLTDPNSQTGDNGLDSRHMTTLYDEQDKEGNVVWPTNTDPNGNEKLVNFKLSRTGIEALVSSLSDEEQKETYIDGDKLYLTAYGHKYGEADNVFRKYTYVVDLSKYEDGETLDIWVPAVILDYYYPINDRSEGNKTLDELKDKYLSGKDEKTLQTETLNSKDRYTVTKGKELDAIIRGHSIKLNTLNDSYTTGVMDNSREDQTWYYWDSIDNEWKEFTALTPVKSYSMGSSLEDVKPIVGLHTHAWNEEKRETLLPSDCRYHGLAGDPCTDPDCDKVHTVVLPLEDHLWLNKDNISESGLTLTETENDGYVDADGNKYQIDENGNLWKITKEATLTEEGEMMLVCIRYPDKVDAADAEKDFVPVVDEIITSEYASKIKNGDVKVEYKLSDNFTGEKESAHYQVKAIEKLKPVVPVPEKEKKDGGDDDIVPVVPPVVPVVPTETTETTVPVVPVAETTTPVVPAEPVAPATPADTTPKLPQTGADWFSAIGMAAAGLALSIGSLFGKGKHEKE